MVESLAQAERRCQEEMLKCGLPRSFDGLAQLAPDAFDVGQGAPAEPADLGGGVRAEVRRQVVAAEALEDPVQDARRRGVVERRLRDTGHARNVFAAPADTQELSDRPLQCRDAARRAAAVGAVESLSVERVVESRADYFGHALHA